MKGKKSSLRLKEARIAHLDMMLDRLFAWMYEDAKISVWNGQVSQMRFFATTPQSEFLRDVKYVPQEFMVFEQGIPQKEGPLTVPSGSLGQLSVQKGFYVVVQK